MRDKIVSSKYAHTVPKSAKDKQGLRKIADKLVSEIYLKQRQLLKQPYLNPGEVFKTDQNSLDKQSHSVRVLTIKGIKQVYFITGSATAFTHS